MSEDAVTKSLDRLIDKVDDVQKDVYQVKIDMAEHKVLFNEHLEQDKQMYSSLNNIEDHMSKLDMHLSEYNKQLEIHIAGVNELRESNRIEKEKLELYKSELTRELAELRKPAIVMKGILWIAGAVAAIGGAVKLFLP